MENLKALLDKKRFVQNKSSRPINPRFEQAEEFGKYVGLPTLVVLRLFKLYSQEKVLSIKSWLYDVPCDPSRGGKIALAHWKLKQMVAVKV